MAKVKREINGTKKLEKILEKISGIETSVGWFPGAKYQNGTPVASVAIKNEYGSASKGVPPRSFMRTTIAEKKNEWSKLAKSGAKAVVNGNTTAVNVMQGLGLASSGDIKKKISEITSPALSPATIKSRQSKLSAGKKVGSLTKPLVETSLMLSSLTSSVKTK